jgi:hypothetical protein
MGTPRARGCACCALHALPEVSIGRPSSSMKPDGEASGRAPHMARSLTVPQTARLPMSPPGKKSGLTTKESVEKASRAPPASGGRRRAAGPAGVGRRTGLQTCARMSIVAEPPAAAVGHQHMRDSRRWGSGIAVEGSEDMVSRGFRFWFHPMIHSPVLVVGGARAFGGDHRRAQRMFPACSGCRRRAFVRLFEPLHDLAGDADRRLLRGDAGDGEALSASKAA